MKVWLRLTNLHGMKCLRTAIFLWVQITYGLWKSCINQVLHTAMLLCIKTEDAFIFLEKINRVVSKEEKLRGTISATLIKDFYTDYLPKEKILQENKFIEFTAEPNMLIKIPEKINSLTDYTALFSKKYRNRAKHILI